MQIFHFDVLISNSTLFESGVEITENNTSSLEQSLYFLKLYVIWEKLECEFAIY